MVVVWGSASLSAPPHRGQRRPWVRASGASSRSTGRARLARASRRRGLSFAKRAAPKSWTGRCMSASSRASPQITAGAMARAIALSRTRMPCIWASMDGWMYMCVCIHPCMPFECQTDGSSNLAPGGAAQTQVGLWTPSSHHRPSTSSRGVSCPAAREAVGRRCAHRSRVVVCRCQWVRRDGVSSCRFRGPGGGGSDTKRGDAGQGFRHAGVGSAAAWA